MADTARTLETVRDPSGGIYVTTGAGQARRIPNPEEYQRGVQAGIYSATPRQVQSSPMAGAGGQTYLGGYEVGTPMTVDEAQSGQSLAQATPTRTIPQVGGESRTPLPAGGAGAAGGGSSVASSVQSRMQSIITGGGVGVDNSKRISGLRGQEARLQDEAFRTGTEYTADDLRHLTPGQQAELRRQRISGLSGQLGNVQSAIKTLKDEEEKSASLAEKSRTLAMDTLNTYLKYGVLDQLSPEDQVKLAAASGLDDKAVAAIAKQAATGEPPELKSIGGNLYSVSWNAETGTFDTKLIVGKNGAGGGGGSSGGGGRGGSGGGASKATTKNLNGGSMVSDKELNKLLTGTPGEFKVWYKGTYGTKYPTNATAIKDELARWKDTEAKKKASAKTKLSDPFAS